MIHSAEDARVLSADFGRHISLLPEFRKLVPHVLKDLVTFYHSSKAISDFKLGRHKEPYFTQTTLQNIAASLPPTVLHFCVEQTTQYVRKWTFHVQKPTWSN